MSFPPFAQFRMTHVSQAPAWHDCSNVPLGWSKLHCCSLYHFVHHGTMLSRYLLPSPRLGNCQPCERLPIQVLSADLHILWATVSWYNQTNTKAHDLHGHHTIWKPAPISRAAWFGSYPSRLGRAAEQWWKQTNKDLSAQLASFGFLSSDAGRD
jgi:hypothetical protein